MAMLPVRMPVLVDRERRGVIAGYAFHHVVGEVCAKYLVELTPGFFSPDQQTYVSLLVVHPDNITLRET